MASTSTLTKRSKNILSKSQVIRACRALESETEADPGEESGAVTGGVLASDHLQAFALSWGSGRHGTIHCARCVLHAQGDL